MTLTGKVVVLHYDDFSLQTLCRILTFIKYKVLHIARHKTHWGVELQLGTKVGGQRHAAATLSQGKTPSAHCAGGRVGGPPCLHGCRDEKNNHLPRQGIESQTV